AHQTPERIVEEIATLPALIDFGQVAKRVIRIACLVSYSIRVFYHLRKAAQRVGFAAALLVRRALHRHLIADVCRLYRIAATCSLEPPLRPTPGHMRHHVSPRPQR